MAEHNNNIDSASATSYQPLVWCPMVFSCANQAQSLSDLLGGLFSCCICRWAGIVFLIIYFTLFWLLVLLKDHHFEVLRHLLDISGEEHMAIQSQRPEWHHKPQDGAEIGSNGSEVLEEYLTLIRYCPLDKHGSSKIVPLENLNVHLPNNQAVVDSWCQSTVWFRPVNILWSKNIS